LLKKTDAIELQEFDLNDVIRDALRIAGPQALKEGIDFFGIPMALVVFDLMRTLRRFRLLTSHGAV
jgi:hypothetical protein